MEDARQGESRMSDQRQRFSANGFLLGDKATAPCSDQPNFCAHINLVFLIRQGAKMTASASQLTAFSCL